MNIEFGNIKTIKFISICILMSFLLNACSSTKYGEKVVPIKLVNWQVNFKENASEEDKANALLLIDKYILDYLYNQKPDTKLFYINFSHIPVTNNPNIPNLSKSAIRVLVTLGEKAGKKAAPGPVPVGPGPIMPPGVGEILSIQ